jgi:zinc and cadmium transporter
MQGSAAFLVPFAAGNFIYIAGSDLIPELHKQEPEPLKSALQLIAFVLGVLTLLSLTFLE